MLNYEVIYKNKLGIEESITVKEETINDIVVTIYQQLSAINAEIIRLDWIEEKALPSELVDEDKEIIEKYEQYCKGTDKPLSFAKWFGVWD